MEGIVYTKICYCKCRVARQSAERIVLLTCLLCKAYKSFKFFSLNTLTVYKQVYAIIQFKSSSIIYNQCISTFTIEQLVRIYIQDFNESSTDMLQVICEI